MARKAAHDQRVTPTDWVCDSCRSDDCSDCIDVLRVKILMREPICYCKRKKHGETADARMEASDGNTGEVE